MASSQFSDDYADTKIEVDGVNGCMAALAKLKHERPHLKTLLSLGGGGEGSSKFAQVARSEGSRRVFAQHVREIVDLHGFDGVDSKKYPIREQASDFVS